MVPAGSERLYGQLDCADSCLGVTGELQPPARFMVSCRGSNKESLVCASSSTDEDMWCTTMDGLGGLYTQIRAVAKPCGSDLPSDILDVDF